MPKRLLRFIQPQYHRGALIVGTIVFGCTTLVVFLAVLLGIRAADIDRRIDLAIRVLTYGGSITAIMFVLARNERGIQKAEEAVQKTERVAHMQEEATTAAAVAAKKAEEVGKKIEAIDRRTNGGLNAQVKAAVAEAVPAAISAVSPAVAEEIKRHPCDEILDIKHEIHVVKHHLANLDHRISLCVEETEARRQAPPGTKPPGA